jgi:hypothetical protein
MNIAGFDKKNVKDIRQAVREALGEVGKKYGIVFNAENTIRFDNNEMTLKLEAKTVAGADPLVQFKKEAKRLGIDPVYYGATFPFRGENFQIVELSSRSHKYPIIAQNSKGQKYKFGADMLDKVNGMVGGMQNKPKKRTEFDIMKDILDVYGSLEPEALTCDGELSRTEVDRRYAELTRKLRRLEVELGRKVSEDESWKWMEKNKKKLDKLRGW